MPPSTSPALIAHQPRRCRDRAVKFSFMPFSQSAVAPRSSFVPGSAGDDRSVSAPEGEAAQRPLPVGSARSISDFGSWSSFELVLGYSEIAPLRAA